jgi:hypothetical protein
MLEDLAGVDCSPLEGVGEPMSMMAVAITAARTTITIAPTHPMGFLLSGSPHWGQLGAFLLTAAPHALHFFRFAMPVPLIGLHR